MKKLTILFDADDTVENLSDYWIAMLNERYGTSVTPEDVHGWDISLAFPTLTKEQVFGVLHDLVGGEYAKILFDRPHNRSFDHVAHDALRVNTWEEIDQVIHSYLL